MPASTISLSNRSLLSIGARSQISSLTEGSTESNAIATLFSPVFETLGRAAHWNCLRNQQTLSLLAAAVGTPENPDGLTLPLPPSPWLYACAYPSDCLQMRFIVPSFPSSTPTGTVPLTTASVGAGSLIPGEGQIPYAVAYSTDSDNNPITIILTNQSQAQAVYTVNQPNPVIWDSQFQTAFVASLAAYLVPALSLNMALMKMSIATAESIIAQARAADGNESVVTQNRQASWMTARVAGGSLGWESNGSYAPWLYANYSAMQWPF